MHGRCRGREALAVADHLHRRYGVEYEVIAERSPILGPESPPRASVPIRPPSGTGLSPRTEAAARRQAGQRAASLWLFIEALVPVVLEHRHLAGRDRHLHGTGGVFGAEEAAGRSDLVPLSQTFDRLQQGAGTGRMSRPAEIVGGWNLRVAVSMSGLSLHWS
jgi:hypothetical protein